MAHELLGDLTPKPSSSKGYWLTNKMLTISIHFPQLRKMCNNSVHMLDMSTDTSMCNLHGTVDNCLIHRTQHYTKQSMHILYFSDHKTHQNIRRTLIFSFDFLEKNNGECILILVIYWKKTGLVHTKISNHNLIYSS